MENTLTYYLKESKTTVFRGIVLQEYMKFIKHPRKDIFYSMVYKAVNDKSDAKAFVEPQKAVDHYQRWMQENSTV